MVFITIRRQCMSKDRNIITGLMVMRRTMMIDTRDESAGRKSLDPLVDPPSRYPLGVRFPGVDDY